MSQTPADKIIDAREMEPPEPMVLTLEALDTLGPNEKLMLILTREPHPLYRKLQSMGFTYKTEVTIQGTIEILIWRPQP
jgi:tRNA 2-thiouridine synthesizing protein A